MDVNNCKKSGRIKNTVLNSYKAFFSIKKYNGFTCFDKISFKQAISFILNNTYVAFGGYILRQTRGVPMGGGCSSPVADLYLSSKEFRFMKRLLQEKKFHLAKLLSNNSRYVDDLNIINYRKFNNRANEIYPADLLLERSGDNEKDVAYLDVRIKISDKGVVTSLYNKTDEFNFPVVNFTFPESNIPIQLGYNVFYGQVLRYSTIISDRREFIVKSSQLFFKLRRRGYRHHILSKSFKKIFNKNTSILYKFGFKDSYEAITELHHYITNLTI